MFEGLGLGSWALGLGLLDSLDFNIDIPIVRFSTVFLATTKAILDFNIGIPLALRNSIVDVILHNQKLKYAFSHRGFLGTPVLLLLLIFLTTIEYLNFK